MNDELQQQLDSLARDECYRVDSVLKNSQLERTERVFFVGQNGSEQGPYIRKYFDCEAGLGGAYRRILDAQRQGARFLHLPRIFDCYSVGEQDAVVMECVPGKTLADVVYECDPSVELAKRLFPEVCDAICELHERFDPPLIHRDIKPSNFMVEGNAVFVIDLGIARTFDADATTDTKHFGTRAYAPPEQFGYGQTDERSDVYALGMLLFYLLCEETPEVNHIAQVLATHNVPSVLRDVVLQAVSFDPADRFQSVKALARAFDSSIAVVQQSSDAIACGNPYDVGIDISCKSVEACVAPHEEPISTASQGSMPAPVKTKSSVKANMRKLFSRVPYWLGFSWDVLLIIWVVLLAVICVNSIFNTSGDTALLPIPARAATFAFTCLLFISPMPLLFDPRPVYRVLPRVRRRSYRAHIIAAVVLFAVGFMGVALVGNLVLPYYK
ncbi:serine/threonine-protein kinase [uncultured Senegalimassilia sp.]|uniref:serine/threonine protein kinase n=1 Tax=uncultured Senegalimassilia sp. TaxID=1714350 RepID=UPI002676897F|nr:serine/threonine-protein kinase [uncultured Senegalimassilia sp.]